MIKKILLLVLCIAMQIVSAQITTSINPTIAQMQNLLQGNGILVSGLTITCPAGGYATFNNGAAALGGNLNSGILLTTGTASNIAGPNTTANNLSYNASAAGSPLGNALSGGTTYDGCYINFLVTPSCSTLSINYVFASEEYPEYSVGTYNDVFGFVISGPNPAGGNFNQSNIATLPGTTTPVSIQNVNNGTSNTGPCKNCAYYIANPPGLSYDGCTTVLTASTLVTPCQQYTMTVGVWDDADGSFDSGVFLDFNGISCTNTSTINATASTNTLCSMQSVTLTAGGGYSSGTYSWTSSANGNLASTSGQTVIANPTGSSSYTLSYQDSTLCSGIYLSQVVNVNFNVPSFSVTSNPGGILCTGETTTLTAMAGAGSYTWTPNTFLSADNIPSVVCTPTASTTYTVNYEDVNGCSASSVSTVSVSLCTGINSLSEPEKSVAVYPNPVNSKLYFTSEFKFDHIKVYDQNGRQLVVPVNAGYINCNQLNSGVYTIEFKTEQSTFYRKFVKMD